MTGFVVVGTDTDAGKTTFSLLFLAAFADQFAYWKPVETGPSDTDRVRRLVPSATVFDPLARFAEPVAPALAARRERRPMPGVAAIVAAVPRSSLPVLIETFGGPFSPLTDDVLQVELLAALRWPVVLVGSSAVGAVGRALAAVRALEGEHIRPTAVVLVGPRDAYAEGQIGRHADVSVFGLTPPAGEWTAEGVAGAAREQRDTLERLRTTHLVSRDPESAARIADPATPSQVAPPAPLRGLRVAANQVPSLLARDAAAVWHPYTPLRPADPPLPVVAADAEFLTLADGRTLVDAVSSWWTTLHGHREPSIMRAVRDATRTLDHVLFAGATHPHAVELADALLAAMPWPAGGRAFFSDNGSTAVEVALKMAYQLWCHRGETGRTLFVGLENGYHGDTFGAMSVSRDPVFFGRFDPLLFQTLRVPIDAGALDAALSQHAGRVAAVVAEPLVQGAGGMRMHTPAELRALFEVARRHGVLFVADEVMTGFGRTGSRWAFEQAGIAPDLVCLSKGTTGGVLPLAVTLAAPAVVAEFDTADRGRTLYHGHSYTANPLACAAAVASWKLMETGRWKHDVARIEHFWHDRLTPLAARPGVVHVRVRGLIGAVELDLPGGYLADGGSAMRRAAVDRGVLLRPLGNVLYAMPPFCTSDESLARIADAMSAAIDSIQPH